jgi:hypothetical protein
MPERQHDIMSKRPSLFNAKPIEPATASTVDMPEILPAPAASVPSGPAPKLAPSRVGKRVLSLYLDPLAWKQLRQLALDHNTTAQALGEEAINLLFAKHGLNRSA